MLPNPGAVAWRFWRPVPKSKEGLLQQQSHHRHVPDLNSVLMEAHHLFALCKSCILQIQTHISSKETWLMNLYFSCTPLT